MGNSPVLFYEWLKSRRRALDLTQDELSQRAGCSVSAYRKIESGERRPSKQLARLLAEALEIPGEDQQTFIRVARGELNVEWLRQPGPGSLQPSATRDRSLSEAETRALLPAPSNRIPTPVTPLIGREPELAALERLFNDPSCRLLTLTGMGGIGKTRLAIELVSREIPMFAGGVFYVPLSPVNSPEKIIPTIADVLDFRFSGHNDPKEQLFSYISNDLKQQALFVLDNLEHLLVQNPPVDGKSGLAELVSEILQRLPNVKILATSRERLNVHGEWTYELYGLSVPPVDFAGRLESYDSVALFVKCAQRARADFQVAVGEQAPVVRICRLVEGVPLAIELAATWVALLSLQEIAEEIKSSLDFLSTSMRDLPERHRSIRATFEHSWRLLSAEERRVLCQLALFHGGFDRRAAAEIAGASLALLASLMAKSLVRRSENGRYDLHEVVRQYALSHLDRDPRNLAAYERHSDYYLSVVQDHENSLKSASQQAAVRRLTDDIDNIRAAWIWAVKHARFTRLGRAARSFGWYFEVAGLYRDGIEQLELLVQALKAEPADVERQRLLGLALIHEALLHFRGGDVDRAQNHYEEGISILRPVGDQILLADGLIYLGIILHLKGEYERAKALLEEGLQLARASDEPWLEAYALYNLGYIASLMGRHEEGYEQMHAGLATWRALGDPHAIALGLNFLVPTLDKLGRYQEAKTFMQESITLCAQTKNRWGMGTAYRYLGLATMAEGQPEEAQIYLRKSLDIFGEDFVGWHTARSLTYLADAIMMSGDREQARNDYRDALRMSIEARAMPVALDALWGLASLEAQSGNAETALVLCCFILNHPSSEDETICRADHLCQSLHKKLAVQQIKAARAIAATSTFDMIVKEIREAA